MSLDPISAVGLAANVIQFVDFGCRLLSESNEIYHSATGATGKNIDLQRIAESLSCLSERLITPTSESKKPTSSPEEEIRGIASLCKEISNELLSTINRMKIVEGPHRRWRSFKHALEGTWKRDKIVGLHKKLDELRSQLSVQIIAHISKRQTRVLQSLKRLQEQCAEIERSQRSRVESLVESLQNLVERDKEFTMERLNIIEEKLSRSSDEARKLTKEQKILSSLLFERMAARHFSISEAHTKTFEWIFEPYRWRPLDPRSRVCFCRWLLQEDGIYWISGKPGSGKSTLMKYLSQCEKTQEHLRVWAKGARLAIPRFYFWITGTDMQRSQRGLLQQLLFEIFLAFPDFIPIICPKQWRGSGDNLNLEWSLPDLLEAFNHFHDDKAQTLHLTKICFFIDGLDEFNGDHFELIKTVQTIAKLKNVKVCVSSRPWNCFEDAFGQDHRHKIYLQDLTTDDIAKYARDKLEEIPGFIVLRSDAARYQLFIADIVHGAQGVFLWVFLVIKSLREGITNGDDISLLHERLLELPSDLEQFFERLIRSVDKVYRKRMSATFQVALQAPRPLSLIQYSFVDKEQRSFATQTSVTIAEEERIMHRQLNGRYKGLLEAPGFPKDTTVDFLHRTVRDFLATKEMQDLLDSHCGTSFNVNICASKAFLEQERLYPGSLSDQKMDIFMFFARNLEIRYGRSDKCLLDDMNKFHCPGLAHHLGRQYCLGKAIRFGLVSYIEHVMARDPSFVWRCEGEALLLALNPQIELLEPDSIRLTSYEMVNILLQHGANPNQVRYGRTVFREFLELYDTWETELDFRLFGQSLALLLHHGADIRAAFEGPNCWFSRALGHITNIHKHVGTYGHCLKCQGTLSAIDLSFDYGLVVSPLGATHSRPGEKPDIWGSLLVAVLQSQTDHGTAESLCFQLIKTFLTQGADPFYRVACGSDRLSRDSFSVSEAVDEVFTSERHEELIALISRAIQNRAAQRRNSISSTRLRRRDLTSSHYVNNRYSKERTQGGRHCKR